MAAALLAAMLLTACQGEGRSGGNGRKGGSITVGLSSRPDSLDPALADSQRAREALWLVYTPPVTYARAEGPAGVKLIPGLAESLPRLSNDGRSYAFRFRRGLRYSNGRPLRARDFARTLERARSLGPRGRHLFADVRRVATDDRRRRVVIELRRRDSTFPFALADVAAGLVPGDTPVRRAVRQPPPGIGPYVVGGVTARGSFSLRRRRSLRLPGIPGGNLDRIEVSIVPSRERQVREVIAGSLDYTPDSAPTDLLPLIRSKYRDRYGEHRTLSSHWLALNSRRKPFDDERVRRAVNFAVDGTKLERLSLGFLEPSCNLLPHDLPGYSRLDPCPYGSRTAPADLVRARTLIDKADARGTRVTLLASRAGDGPRISRYFASTLTKIGLRTRRRLVTGAVAPSRRDQAWLAGWRAGLPHPAEPLALVRSQDAAIDVETAALAREPLEGDHVLEDWASLDRRLVEGAFAVPYGSDKRSMLLSERLDFANCSRFHPVYGSDWSSFCLK